MKRIVAALALVIVSAAPTAPVSATDVPILDTSIDRFGQIHIRVASTPDDYFVLHAIDPNGTGGDEVVSVMLGEADTTTLTEPLSALAADRYRVERRSVNNPGDLDEDGIDDVTERTELGAMAPLNPAPAIEMRDGTNAIPDRATFEALSYEGREVRIDTHLEDLEFVKFYLLEMNTDRPQVYFMNTVTHRAHGSFARAVGIERGERGPGRGGLDRPGQMRGEIVYHPNVVGPNGTFGVYRFEFEPNDRYPFADVARAYELIAKNMPYLQNNLTYYPMPDAALPRYRQEKALYDRSRVAILLEEDIYRDVEFIPLHIAEGYGRLRVMDPTERPGARDIVIYEALPNELSRVGGIITTVPQTPLSHVNLRAIQDGVPNAYVRAALDDPTIVHLVDEYVYFRVSADGYEIRAASPAEVEAHYEALRPPTEQVPERDLGRRHIAPLDEIGFDDWRAFGVKAANVATLGTFGFPDGTVPDGFAVPFAFYDRFMEANGLYDEVRTMLADPAFQSDYDVRDRRLDELRDAIRDGTMPTDLRGALADMHAAFPAGTALRCRSSTNNEDLPGFSGAGLYGSYTHHVDEGHMEKSIKQVFASLWTFRAFEERQFHRVDHLQTAMAVLVHPNFEDERANGVGVTTDPFYGTTATYYLNTQIGEDLVTNPEAHSVPEEILVGVAPGSGYTLIRPSSQVPDGVRIMAPQYLEQIREYMGVIDRRFTDLYAPADPDQFAMEIEYKITENGTLAIKQARPWIYSVWERLDEEPPASFTPVATPTGASEPTSTPTPQGAEERSSIFLPAAVLQPAAGHSAP